MRLVVASANPDKVAEIEAIFGDAVDLVPRPTDLADVVEDGDSLEANARLKAEAVCTHVGEAAVADDTGLEVAALDGAPGVYSARFAGEGATYADNVQKLLDDLRTVGALEPDTRVATFRTVAVVRYPDGREVTAEGFVTGAILHEPRGEVGFGYDPIFVPAEGDGRTFAEMAPHEKHDLSHRGRAFRALATALHLSDA
jgi:XTP/dITP diphosphohydrolase